jgi:hypothetical protein
MRWRDSISHMNCSKKELAERDGVYDDSQASQPNFLIWYSTNTNTKGNIATKNA